VVPEGPRRVARLAELLGIGRRNVQLHLAELRALPCRISAPRGTPGRPGRTDYFCSRRKHRRTRALPNIKCDPHDRIFEPLNAIPTITISPPHSLPPSQIRSDPSVQSARAVRAGRTDYELAAEIQTQAERLAETPEDQARAARAVRRILATWPATDPRWARCTPGEAGHVLRTLVEKLGATLAEACEWFECHAPNLDTGRAHTPWRAAASREHAGAWLAARRSRERAELLELARERAERRAERAAPGERAPLGRCAPPTPAALAFLAQIRRKTG